MTTRFRTWVLIAGLSALFVSLGAFVGGTGGLVLFLLLSLVGFNFAMYWFSDRIALKVSRAHPLERADQHQTIYDDVEALHARAGPADAAPLRDPVGPAERLCDGPESEARGGGGHTRG